MKSSWCVPLLAFLWWVFFQNVSFFNNYRNRFSRIVSRVPISILSTWMKYQSVLSHFLFRSWFVIWTGCIHMWPHACMPATHYTKWNWIMHRIASCHFCCFVFRCYRSVLTSPQYRTYRVFLLGSFSHDFPGLVLDPLFVWDNMAETLSVLSMILVLKIIVYYVCVSFSFFFLIIFCNSFILYLSYVFHITIGQLQSASLQCYHMLENSDS